MAEDNPDVDFPSEIQDRLENFHDALMELKETLAPLLDSNFSEVQENLTPLEKAKLHLTTTYTVNSLFWMYLNTIGEDPKQHPIKQELDRIKNYMNRAKEIEDKAKASKLNKDAAQRFIRNSLWQPNTGKHAQDSSRPSNSSENEQNTWAWQSIPTPVSQNTAYDLIREWKQEMSEEFSGPSHEVNTKQNGQSCSFSQEAPANTDSNLREDEESSDSSAEQSTSAPLRIQIKVEAEDNTRVKCETGDSHEATVAKRKCRK